MRSFYEYLNISFYFGGGMLLNMIPKNKLYKFQLFIDGRNMISLILVFLPYGLAKFSGYFLGSFYIRIFEAVSP